MVVTSRDVAILRRLQEMRFLTCDQIQRLEFSPSTTSACKRRLTVLYHNGYVDRVYMPVVAPGGAARALYCLDRRGAGLLALEDGVASRDVSWRRQKNDRDLFFLAHLLDANDVRISVAAACAREGWLMRWTDERTLRRYLSRETVPDRRGKGSLKVIPDGHFQIDVFGVGYSFALELDRNTVEEKRIRQKVRGYGEWLRLGRYRSRFGEDSLRVLFVVSGRAPRSERLRRLVEWCESEGGRSLFWFTEIDQVLSRDVLRDAIWRVAGTPERQALFDGPSFAVSTMAAQRRLPEVR